ncbi:MAG: transaldolase / glucose-6-phosphate isomerase [Pseudonocardiales bacterium]|nr:transaldolase / glucose-6-phosphate isomerase [Pseudonocardiales bacterium]
MRSALDENIEDAHAILPGHGIDLAAVTDQLVTEGVDKFTEAFRQLLSSVEQALAGPSKTEPWRLRRSLPRDLAEWVDATVDEWRATGKVDRVQRGQLAGLARCGAGPSGPRPPLRRSHPSGPPCWLH